MTRYCFKNKGLTLVELLVAMVVLALIIGVGVPGMQSLMANMNIRTNTDKLVNSLAYARGEAVARVENVSIRSVDGNADWSKGWTVFVDKNGDCVNDNGTDEVLRVVDLSAENLTVTASSNQAGCLTFDRLGESASTTSTSFDLSKDGGTSNGVTVSNTGFASKK